MFVFIDIIYLSVNKYERYGNSEQFINTQKCEINTKFLQKVCRKEIKMIKKIDYKYINPNKIKSVNKPTSYKNSKRQPRDIDEYIFGCNMDKHSYK